MHYNYTIDLAECNQRDWQIFEDFTETMTARLLADIASGADPTKITVCFSYVVEGTVVLVNNKWFMHAIHDFCTKHNILLSNVTYLGTNFRMREVYDKWHSIYAADQGKINLRYVNFGIILYHKNSALRSALHIPSKPAAGLRPKKINCLNSNMEIVCRPFLLKEMHEQNLLDTENNILSFHLSLPSNIVELPSELYAKCPIQYDVTGNWEEVNAALLKPRLGAEFDYNKAGDYSHIYDATYITVTTESSECYSFGGCYSMNEEVDEYMNEFHREGFLTEKIFRPMLYWQPQLILCTNGTIQHLHELGFKTFGDFWDESYDQEPDGVKRVKMVAAIIKDIYSMSSQDLHDMYWAMMPILEHNRNMVLDMQHTETTQ